MSINKIKINYLQNQFFIYISIIYFIINLINIKNNVGAHDSAAFALPLTIDIIKSLKDGSINLWDFYDLGGVPLLGAHLQNQSFTLVFILPTLLLNKLDISPLIISQIIHIIKIYLSLFFTYLLIKNNIRRQDNLTKYIIILILFFSSIATNGIAQPGIVDSFYLIPALLYLLLYFDSKKINYAIYISLIITQSFFSYFIIPYFFIIIIYFFYIMKINKLNLMHSIQKIFGNRINFIIISFTLTITIILNLNLLDSQYISPMRLNDIKENIIGGTSNSPLSNKNFSNSSSIINNYTLSKTGTFISLDSITKITTLKNNIGETWLYLSPIGILLLLISLSQKENISKDNFFIGVLLTFFIIIIGMNSFLYQYLRYLMPPLLILRHTELLQNTFMMVLIYFISKFRFEKISYLLNPNFFIAYFKNLIIIIVLVLIFHNKYVILSSDYILTYCLLLVIGILLVLTKNLEKFYCFIIPLIIFLIVNQGIFIDNTQLYNQSSKLLFANMSLILLFYIIYKKNINYNLSIWFSIINTSLIDNFEINLSFGRIVDISSFIMILLAFAYYIFVKRSSKILMFSFLLILAPNLIVYNVIKYKESWMDNTCIKASIDEISKNTHVKERIPAQV